MYQVLPRSSAVGQIGVVSEARQVAHSINFFAVPDSTGKLQHIAYDQQSGAISSKPYSTIDEAVKDPQFQNRTNQAFGNDVINPGVPRRPIEIPKNWEVDYGYSPIAKGELPKPLPGPVGDGTYRKQNVGFPKGAVQINNDGKSASVYTPKDPNFMAQKLTQPVYLRPLGLPHQGVVKDGTHGTFGVPEKAEWYHPNVKYRPNTTGAK